MSSPIHITDQTFAEEVLNTKGPVLVDFWAEWCAPCKMIAPVIEELAADHADTLKVAKLNVDLSQETPLKYFVGSIPTLVLFKDGQEVGRFVGYMPKKQLLEKLNRFLKP